MKQGKCFACDVLGPEGREDNFLCENCADQNAATVVCSKCKNREQFDTDEGMTLLAKYLPPECEVARGSVFRIDCCPACTDILPKERSVQHFTIAI